ncbi:hypothetical protein GJAV_G00128850 [Gymnothorax javanicus]|nr:hypothetical protein GJAV_G00128850 [Gymnothorax javanicus]
MHDLSERQEDSADGAMENSVGTEAPDPRREQCGPTITDVTVDLRTSILGKRHHSLYEGLNGCELGGFHKNGTDYGYLVRQNSELLRALSELEKTCATLKEENGLLRKSSSPETEEKVKRLRRKNAELAVIAKRLEERARKLQEANLKVVNAPIPLKPGSVEQYKRAFARQRARDLAQHADTLLCKDKEIAALQQECRELQAQLGTGEVSPSPTGALEFERLLRESQKEVLRLQRQLAVSSCKEPVGGRIQNKVAPETPLPVVDEAPAKCEEARGEEEDGQRPLTTFRAQGDQTEEQCLQLLESELSKKRKECESLEHEVKKRQKRCLDLESQLEDEQRRNERLVEDANRLSLKAQLLTQIQVENEVLRDDLSEVTAHRNSVLEENQKLRAKLENLEQVLKHMREVAERRQQLELEHEQALAVLKFKQDEIKRLQRAQFFAKREQEGVVQMLESKVRELEEKCRSQSEQFSILSQELERFRLQTSRTDMAGGSVLSNPGLSHLMNGIGPSGERDFGHSRPAAAQLHPSAPRRAQCSPGTRHRELPTISAKSGSSSSTPKSDSKNLTPKSVSLQHSPRKSSPTLEVDTASEVEELDIDVSPIPFPGSRVAAKLQVFIARYSYNPYDGPNDNPEVELPLTAGEYIYVYGDMDDDGFYEGELMDGRRGLVPSNFVERVSDDDVMSLHPPEAGELSHSSFQDSSLHSEKHLRFTLSTSGKAEIPASEKSQAPLTNGLDLDMEEAGVDSVPYPRKLMLIKQLAKSIIIGWDPPLVPAGWGTVCSYNVFVDEELRLNVPFGAQTKAVLERLDLALKAYRVSVQSLTSRGSSDQLRCSLLVGRDVTVAPTCLKVDCISATSANLMWLPSNSNYVHVVYLNDEERELVKAGCFSLCLSNLQPNKQYMVKVEARAHRTPWELPLERREHKSASASFTTLMAGPPDAPLDVQLDLGPSPGIALVSWLPVTIDAAGTSNGVRVTGYTIFADKNKVLEVSSPTAGSALLGPSQIHILKSAQELTVRTTSPHGESADSVPVKVQPKLIAITTGVVPLQPSQPGLSSSGSPEDPTSQGSLLPPLSTSAKQPPQFHIPPPEALSSPRWSSTEAPKMEPSCTKALMDPLVPNRDASVIPNEVAARSQLHSSSMVSATLSSCTNMAFESRTDPDSPLARRPPVSISEFLDEAASTAKPSSPLSSGSQLPLENQPMTTRDPQPARPVQPSLLDSETEDESSLSTRVVSIEEFLDPSQHRLAQAHDGSYLRSGQDHMAGQLEPLSEYQLESSRGSDLSDILEEEEEDLYSDPAAEERSRGYSLSAASRLNVWEADSDEEAHEKILKLPLQTCHDKQLLSIAEVTEEEDNCVEPVLSSKRGASFADGSVANSSSSTGRYNSPNEHLSSTKPQSHACFSGEKSGTVPVQRKHKHRVHYADTVETIRYQEEYDSDSSIYVPNKAVRGTVSLGREHRTYPPRDGSSRSGDRLRREALLRSRVASDLTASGQFYHPTQIDQVPAISGAEIDIEYGTEDDEDLDPCGPVEPISSAWWTEDRCLQSQETGALRQKAAPGPNSRTSEVLSQDRSSLQHGKLGHAAKGYSTVDGYARGTDDNGEPQLADPATACHGQSLLKQGHKVTPQVIAGQSEAAPERLVADGELRIFVALFPYNPASMSPNPDAAEEELPFEEGQIIKVYGEKDADGFYRGECDGRTGFVPCNMVSEIQVDDDETKDQLLQQGFLSTEASMEKIGSSEPASGAQALVSRKMVAVFDYDPRESSPNADVEAELKFSAGDIIHVFGVMDDDGFFYGEVNGQKGLVPSNFLQAIPESGDEASLGPMVVRGTLESRRESQVSLTVLEDHSTSPVAPAAEGPSALDPAPSTSPPNPTPSESPSQTDTSPLGKKKKGFFSKGRKLLKKLGSSKKD